MCGDNVRKNKKLYVQGAAENVINITKACTDVCTIHICQHS
nr:MAG TPA: hypothetical protein [Caudoviricetes sp.]